MFKPTTRHSLQHSRYDADVKLHKRASGVAAPGRYPYRLNL